MMRIYGIAILTAALLTSCTGGKVRIDGRFIGSNDDNITLEKVLPGGISFVDSVRTDDKGAFRFMLASPDKLPTIYNIRYGSETIPLLVEPGQRIKVNSIGNISRNYTVEGSEGSALLHELQMLLLNGARSLDSLLTSYGSATEEERARIRSDYTSEYYRIKREHIRFIVSNAGSVAGIFALYQRLPRDTELFNGENDIIYYRMVADSVAVNYPDSPYVKALQRLVATSDTGWELEQMLAREMDQAMNYPDLILPDIYGEEQRLSHFDGKVILIDYWSAADPAARLNNAELKETYEKYNGRGFEVYQVSVDESRSLWVNTVLEQKLPWTTVSVLKGGASVAVMAYNIQSVPANYLISPEGEIVGTNLYGEALEKAVAGLLH